ncbi:hypothetical protein CAPTEDRAFT_173271 [Capitella teleta]|uniref:Protein phosphatase methylesterase 1 n=1 Tax=Capitella teleta TaxID=283909 RepID=R7UPU8_CAPTE|nr:hypothetical protein CAPTEDRAFT_173271 [Capitella teleta]|eukprot:ELU08215.1 hypothetical protein CAPTEDRAFT_173271 [Capitella teleta]
MSELQKRLQMNRLPPMPPKGIGGASGSNAQGGKRGFGRGKRDYTPVMWDAYFATMKDITVSNDNVFRVYEVGTEGPVCFFLHGGGFSALSWSVLSKTLCGLVKCRCAAVDLRGHGDTTTQDETDMSAAVLSKDVGDVISAYYGEEAPPIILIGHSMGGAIAVHTAHHNLVPSLIGLVVIDVVEGTAMEALSSMQSFLRSRPPGFKSLEHAIEYCVRSGAVRNVESARVSMVGQLKRKDTNEPASAVMELSSEEAPPPPGTIAEEDEENEEEEDDSAKKSKSSAGFKRPVNDLHQFVWRIDLSNTEKYWRGWFEGLSNLFLGCSVPKMLLLAGVDRLDKDLTVGQMQGKFQMQVLPQSGHAVHEDCPDKVADVLATFMVRHKVAAPKDDFQSIFPQC